MAGMEDAEIVECILAATPPGDRLVPVSEVEQAVARARSDHGAGSSGASIRSCRPSTRRRRPTFDPLLERAKLIRCGGPCSFDDLIGSASNRCCDTGAAAAIGLITALFHRDDLLCIGTIEDDVPIVKSALAWVDQLERITDDALRLAPNAGPPLLEPQEFELIIANPLTGQPAPRKDGARLTLIGDNCVARHSYAIAEFDTLSLPDQCAFWRGWSQRFPGWLVALVFSGGKSVHAWLRADAPDAEDWRTRIHAGMFGEILIPLGVDPATRNPSRRTRLPGVGSGWGVHRPGGPPPRRPTRLLFLNQHAEAIE
jgi:hypothetical protein